MNFGPKIVTDGLVFYVDPANPVSYISGSLDVNSMIDTTTTGSLLNDLGFSEQNSGTFEFDGIDDDIFFTPNSDDSLFVPTGPFSVSSWFKLTNTISAYQYIFIVGQGGGHDYYIRCRDDGKLELSIRTIIGSPYYTKLSSDDTLTLNKWTNVVAVDDGSNMYLYIDGEQAATPISGTYLKVSTNSREPSMGAFYYSGAPYAGFLNGLISSTSTYNRALTPQEVLQNYNALKGRFN